MKEGSPTEIPIVYTSDLLKSSARAMYLEFKNHNSIIFKDVVLPKVNKEIGSCVYAHELTHVEQDNVGGAIDRITNMETLPILMELLFGDKVADDGSIRDMLIRHRLAYFSGAVREIINDKEMNFERRIKIETYIISIIQGLELYNKYHDYNDERKQDIIDSINKVFNGDILVEDMLDNNNSNYLDVKPKLKTLQRHYKL